MEKNRLMMLIIIVLLVILIGSVGAVSFYALKVLGHGPQQEAPAPEENTKLSVEDIEKVQLSSPISTNLQVGSDGLDHYVKINLSVGVNNTDKKESPKMIETLTLNEMVTRDIILNILRSKTLDELFQPEGQEILKNSIKEALQMEYESNLIVQVYISDLAFS
jgi:flagellar FliL protein